MSSSERTAEQAKIDNVAKMGDEIGSIYSALWQEIAWLHRKWAEYVALFGTNSTRIALLNSAAPTFFRTVQDSLWENVLLHLARVTDSPKSAGRSNLSIRRLASAVSGSPIDSEMLALQAVALEATEFARAWRNRKLAHSDLDLALDEHVDPLAPASRADVVTALASLGELLNVVSVHFLDSTTMFEMDPEGKDAVLLLYILRDGLLHAEERLAKVTSGELGFQHLCRDPL